jgi:hypothetical protein
MPASKSGCEDQQKMSVLFKSALCTLGLSVLSQLALATPSSIGLYIVPGIFFDDGSAVANAANQSSKIHPSFKQALNVPAAVKQLQQFAASRFDSLLPTIDSKNRLRALALSVQVTRASQYQIKKPDGTSDVYLPMTLSLNFSNPMTGEVLQSFSQTRYEVFSSPNQSLNQKDEATIASRYREGFATLLDETLAQARQQFSPYLVEARVADTWKGFVILDRGYQEGIGKGDLMEDADGNEIRIEHSGQHYAVAISVLGQVKEGKAFSRPSMMKLSDVKKPRVLTLVSQGNADLPDAVASQLFSDQLGSKAPFATLPLNSNFSQVQAAIDRNTSLGHEVSGQRALPEYVIRLVLPPVRHFELPTNLDYKVQRQYSAWGFAELLSLDGRVLYAADVSQQISDTVSHGVGFADADRREVVLKNTLNELAGRFAKEISFKPQMLKVSEAAGDQFWVEDKGALQPGQIIRLYHNVGKPGGITEDALVPTWEARVEKRDGQRISAVKIMAIAGHPPAPAKDDVVLLESMANAGATANERVAYCPAEKSQIGSVAIERFDQLAYAVAAESSLNLVNPALVGLVKGRVGGQSGFKKDLALAEISHDQCIEALYRTDRQEQTCSDPVCTAHFNMRIAYRLKKAETVLEKKILEHVFTSSGYLATTPVESVSNLYQTELEKDARGLLGEVVKLLVN